MQRRRPRRKATPPEQLTPTRQNPDFDPYRAYLYANRAWSLRYARVAPGASFLAARQFKLIRVSNAIRRLVRGWQKLLVRARYNIDQRHPNVLFMRSITGKRTRKD